MDPRYLIIVMIYEQQVYRNICAFKQYLNRQFGKIAFEVLEGNIQFVIVSHEQGIQYQKCADYVQRKVLNSKARGWIRQIDREQLPSALFNVYILRSIALQSGRDQLTRV